MRRQVSATTTTINSPVIKSQAIIQYIKTISDSNKTTGKEYKSRLHLFEKFWTSSKYNFTIDDLLINRIFQVNIYEILSNFVSFLVRKNTYTNLTIKHYLVTIRNFLEYYDIEISPRKFRLKVKTPKAVKRTKTPLTRDLIIKILGNCTNFKLKTFVLCLASTAMRAGETCSIRLGDIDFDNCKINIRGEYTKTKVTDMYF